MAFESVFPFVFVILFPIIFVGMWIGVCFLIAHIGGWARLATQYEYHATFSGKTWHFQSGQFRFANYSGCLTIGSDYLGLYLRVLPLFRLGHPPLFIPWHDVTTSEKKGLVFSYSDFSFSEAPSIRLRIMRKLGDKILAARLDASYDP